MTYKTYLFDMDGTLLDTLDDLTAAVNHTLEQYGYPRRTREEVRRGLGNGAVKLMASALPQGEDTPEFAAIMRLYPWHRLVCSSAGRMQADPEHQEGHH